MFVSSALAAVTLALVFPLQDGSLISVLEPAQELQARHEIGSSAGFVTPAQAAYAASLQCDPSPLHLDFEIGAVIYVDADGASVTFSHGPCIEEHNDADGSPEVMYDAVNAKGHTAVVGLWHAHPADAGVASLYDHYQIVSETHQPIWTSLGDTLYVQYWNGSELMPVWGTVVGEIPAVCAHCLT